MILEVVHTAAVHPELAPDDAAAHSLEELGVVDLAVDTPVDRIDRAAVDRVDKIAVFVCTSDRLLALVQLAEYARQNNR